VAISVFSDDENGYSRWLADHPRGHVVNFDEERAITPRIHKVGCHTLERGAGGGDRRTSYSKACSTDRAELDEWHRGTFGEGLREWRCQVCQPSTLGLT
jgi:hypothetical protein